MADDSALPPGSLSFPEWQEPLYAALQERDPQKLQECVFTLEEAITRRKKLLADSPDAEAEKQAIEDAIHTLKVIQVEKLNYPDWVKSKPRGL
jgi:hypothetical protein